MALLDIHEDKDKFECLKNEFLDANILFWAVDITKRDDVEQTFKNILDKFQQIDIVVNAAGILREDNIERIVMTNLVWMTDYGQIAL